MEKKTIYAVFWDGENQENYLALTNTEYENVIKVLQMTRANAIIDLVEIEIEEF